MEKKEYSYEYPRPMVCADAVILSLHACDLYVLLIRRRNEPFKDHWAFPGGFLDMDESLEDCALRELKEETGLEGIALEQYHTESSVDRDPRGRVISTAFLGFTRMEVAQPKPADDAVEAKWFHIFALPQMAFDHFDILNLSFLYLRRKAMAQPLGLDLMPKEFRLAELQCFYELLFQEEYPDYEFEEFMMNSDVVDRLLDEGKDGLVSFNRERYFHLKIDGWCFPLTMSFFPPA